MKKICLLCLFILAISSLLFSQSKEKVKIVNKYVECPLCHNEFEVHIIEKPDTLGGQDTDFLTRSFYSNPIANLIWTCPKCFFSALPQDFLQKKPPPTNANLNLNKIDIKKDVNSITQDDIPSWLKYNNAIIYYESISANPVFLSTLHMKASWACRLTSIEYTPKMEEISQKIFREFTLTPNTSFEVYYQRMAKLISDKLASGSIPKAEHNYWNLVYADFLRSSGDHLQAIPVLKKLKSITGFYKENKKQIDQCIFLCEEEKKHQLLALSLIEKQLAESKLMPEERYNSLYLAGELSRRTGDVKSALIWFKKALDSLPEKHPLRSLIEKQMNIIKSKK